MKFIIPILLLSLLGLERVSAQVRLYQNQKEENEAIKIFNQNYSFENAHNLEIATKIYPLEEDNPSKYVFKIVLGPGSSGTGFFISNQGHFATNFHVLASCLDSRQRQLDELGRNIRCPFVGEYMGKRYPITIISHLSDAHSIGPSKIVVNPGQTVTVSLAKSRLDYGDIVIGKLEIPSKTPAVNLSRSPYLQEIVAKKDIAPLCPALQVIVPGYAFGQLSGATGVVSHSFFNENKLKGFIAQSSGTLCRTATLGRLGSISTVLQKNLGLLLLPGFSGSPVLFDKIHLLGIVSSIGGITQENGSLKMSFLVPSTWIISREAFLDAFFIATSREDPVDEPNKLEPKWIIDGTVYKLKKN